MNKHDWIFLSIIIVLVVLIVGIIVIAKLKADTGLMRYTNSNGEVFKVVRTPIYNLTFYTLLDTNNIFRYYPGDVDKIPLEKDIEKVMNRPEGISVLYVTQDFEFVNKSGSNSVIAATEFAKLLGLTGTFRLNLQAAFTTNVSKSEKPITCADVSNNQSVIYIKEGENKVYSENECLIIQGTKEDIIKVADRFAYYLLGIIPSSV